jgi:hypothetical protein
MKKGSFVVLSMCAVIGGCGKAEDTPKPCPSVICPPVPPPPVCSACPPPPEEPPGATIGIPWRTCNELNGASVCAEGEFRNTPLGQMTDGTTGATRFLFGSIARCMGGYCRGHLINGHQCRNGDKVACQLSVGSPPTGESACTNGSWSKCQ